MATVQQSIEVNASAHKIYSQLTHFENYPRFLDDVKSVEQIDDTHLHWKTEMANRLVEWDARITERQTDQCIAWHNTSGPTNTGKVEIMPLGPDKAEVTFTLDAGTEQVPGSLSGYTEEDMALRLKQGLARLKNMVEADEGGRGGQGQTVAGVTEVNAATPPGMRHIGQMPQDTSQEQHGGFPSSDAAGKFSLPADEAGSAGINQPQPATLSTVEKSGHPGASQAAAPADQLSAQVGPGGASTTATGALGGTDAAAGAHLSGSHGGAQALRHDDVHAGAEGGNRNDAMQTDNISPGVGAEAAGRTGLGTSASADDARTGTGTSSGSGTSLTGGSMSGSRDAGAAPKP